MKKIFYLELILIVFVNYIQIYSQWISIGSTLVPRYFHSAVRLNDGRVLVTGGTENNNWPSNPISSCEIYDPSTETWAQVAPMIYPRSWHKSALLPNNKVLVAGGTTLYCELFNPESGVWQLTDTLSINSHWFGTQWEGIMNSNGKYFLLEQTDSFYCIAQIYDFQTEQWTFTDTIQTVDWHFTVSQIDETVMVAGGMWGVRNCEIYDKYTNSWQEISQMNEGRSSFTATKLLDGNILVTGGESYRGTSMHPKESCEIYNDSTQVWNYVDSMNYARLEHQAVLLKNGKVLIVGGYGDWVLRKQTEIYNQNTNTWENAGDILYGRSGFTLTTLNDSTILLVGGYYYDGTICEVFRYNPTNVENSSSELAISNYKLSQNYPNPFNPSTTIKYQLPEMSFVTIKVYDILGREVATLVNEEKPAGSYEVQFTGNGLTNGIYFYQLKVGQISETKKMILLK
jgi:N-acetylneuraminic acid mutarotase